MAPAQRKAEQLFLGPMKIVKNPDTHRVKSVTMELFGGKKKTALTLTCSDLGEARKQRKDLLKAANVASVPHIRLAEAIKRALAQASRPRQKPRPATP